MIHGIGTDIVRIERLRAALARHGDPFAFRILAEPERAAFQVAADPARLLAKRFAAKEAFGKALGTGVRAPATLHGIRVTHDELGKPLYAYGEELAGLMAARGLQAHLSISDETDNVVAFAIIERLAPR